MKLYMNFTALLHFFSFQKHSPGDIMKRNSCEIFSKIYIKKDFFFVTLIKGLQQLCFLIIWKNGTPDSESTFFEKLTFLTP